MRALTKKAISDVTRRKLRTALTILGIAIGVLGLTAINIASGQLKATFDYYNDTSTQPDIQFYTTPASPAIADDLARQPNVSIAQPEGYESVRWMVGAKRIPLTIAGIEDFEDVRLGDFQLAEGTLPGAGQILLEASDRDLQAEHVGDAITIMVRGQPVQLTISGFARTRGRPSSALLGRGLAYMREADLETTFAQPGVTTFLLKLDDYGQREATAKALAAVFAADGVTVLSVSVGNSNGQTAQTLTTGLFGVMRVLAIIALLLSVFLLLSTITTLVTEQLPIIGTMKAIGARRGQVMRSYLTSVAIYGVLGTIIGLGAGIVAGSALVTYLSNLLNYDVLPLTLTPGALLLSAAIGLLTPLLAALLPIFFGTRVTVHEALSGYGLEAPGRRGAGWARVVGRVFAFIPQTAQLGMRGLFRKRTRALLTLLALVVSGAAFLAVQTTSYSFGAFLGEIFSTYHADIFAGFPRPAPYSAVRTVLAGVPGVSATERLAQTDVTTPWGDALLTGVEPDGTLYQHHQIAGQWIDAAQPGDVVISEDGAQKSGLRIGDTISFHTDLYAATWHIIGIAQDYNGIGPQSFGVLLAPVDQVLAFEHLPATDTGAVMIGSTSRAQSDIDTLAGRVDDALSRAGYQANISTAAQQIQRNQNEFLILYVLLYTVAIIVALVGAMGLFNALAMSVLERRREIGILRSMGATGRKVAQVFWTEGLTLGVVAWLIAVAVGIPASYGFVRLIGHLLVEVPFAFDPLSLVWMLLFVLAVATVASLGPVWAAARVRIARTLRYE